MGRWLAGAFCFFIGMAWAQEWPARPLHLIVPFAAASTPDSTARILAEALRKRVGQPVIVENRPGAGGMIGTNAVAKASPDGYTIGITIVGPLVNNKLIYKSMSYDPDKDLAPITIAVTQPALLVVPADRDIRSLDELIEDVKRRPGKANYASIGVGSLSHLTMELVALETGTEIVHVPYPGSSQAVTALLSGEVDMACLPALSVIGQVRGGKLRVLGQTTSRRTSVLPEVPTLKEQGLDIEAGAWNGIVAPAATPPAILERLRREVAGALREPEVVNALQQQLVEVVASSPEQLVAFMREERDRWTPVIRKAHLEATQ
jgi:tripartite-type tricarboxylate transporter receptor subunit TctC